MTVRPMFVAAILAGSMIVANNPLSADTEVRVRPGMMGVADIGVQDCATFSDMHYHPEDDLTREVGSAGVQGNTDRFVLKFRKP